MLKNVLMWCIRIVIYGQSTIKTRFSGWGTAFQWLLWHVRFKLWLLHLRLLSLRDHWRLALVEARLEWLRKEASLLVLVAVVALVGSGCMGAIEDQAAASRARAEAEADRTVIQAEAEARAVELEAQAQADAERARAEAERIAAQAEADRAVSEIQRALGDRAISEAVADQVAANSEVIRARATVERARASQYKANTWAIYALAGAGLLMLVGVALRLILAGIANVRQANYGPRIIEAPRRPRAIGRYERSQLVDQDGTRMIQAELVERS